MENEEYLDKFEERINVGLREFLLAKGEIEKIEPDAVDIEDKWTAVAQSYIQDGVREFNGYPTVSLGWMMFVGMAVAAMWDEDWERYSKVADFYLSLRDVRGYDCMDEYICEEVLRLDEAGAKATSELVRDSANMAYRTLMHEGFEPGTPMAFHGYVRTLHQMYRFGYAVQLKRMGYKMTKME